MQSESRSESRFNADYVRQKWYSSAISIATRYRVFFSPDGEEELNETIEIGIREIYESRVIYESGRRKLSDVVEEGDLNLVRTTCEAAYIARRENYKLSQIEDENQFSVAEITKKIFQTAKNNFCPMFPFC